MQRRKFLETANLAGIGLVGIDVTSAGCARAGSSAAGLSSPGLTLRPYQLLCTFCSLGQPGSQRQDEDTKRIREAVRENPDMPITLTCNTGDVYVYQDPGTNKDTPEGRDFNRKRDLDVLRILDLAPGSTMPARALFMTVHKTIPTVSGICSYGAVTNEAWRGCSKATSGSYEEGHKKGIAALITPRTEEEMAQEKKKSLEALSSAKEVTIRPHILLCGVCQYGGGTRPPFKADNLPDLMQLILTKNPDVMIKMARQADWMMCAPCPVRVPKLNACVNVLGSGGLSNEKRDLDMLQKLGLQFGSTMKARDLYRLIFERIPTTKEICGRDNAMPSVWWDGCGESNRVRGNPHYEKGKKELIEKLKLA